MRNKKFDLFRRASFRKLDHSWTFSRLSGNLPGV